ncbi:MAG: hypothetical protein COU29_03120 [Candidatus Magasanikbacteria bacterium CG10_big_fil_rev_8_21_14_0_10_36_32]|uniref:DUF5666 domain-containing protein n=1 Tax=Candidatus Magasanikbacteria bacterium CG10_big_fil_rev_8_21_14_0_10_36_32 TaxID=1974646 RepID=A0A2M6W616_9BACT|nr:MAG: hypothetical protein COU29_03120 [Candidatus Magasanikbacteria bacterium CG10_big_fil_rev_8_21_14_0_10_36_32]
MKNKKLFLSIVIMAVIISGVSIASVALANTTKNNSVKFGSRGQHQFGAMDKEIMTGQLGKGTRSINVENNDKRELHGEPCNQQKYGMRGKVTAISGTSITLTGKQGFNKDVANIIYTVDVSNATVKTFAKGDDDKPSVVVITVADIKVNDMIIVRGEMNDAAIVATEIMIGQPGKGPGLMNSEIRGRMLMRANNVKGKNFYDPKLVDDNEIVN